MATPPRPPQPIEIQYHLHSPIAEGTYGKVSKGVSFQLGADPSPVAVKQLKGSNPGALNTEINIFHIFDKIAHSLRMRHGEIGGQPWIAVDRIPGQDLFRAMRAKEFLTFDEIVTVAKQFLEFLSGVHELGYFHGDIKSDNAALERACRHLIVFDYNGAGQVGVKPSSQVMQGAAYKSPEIILLGNAGTSLDIWSLGCLLFEQITHRPLFPIQFTPSPYDTHISDNQHLHMIADILGIPPLEFLMQCKKRGLYFAKDSADVVKFKKELTPVDEATWKAIYSEYRTAIQEKRTPSDAIEKVYWRQIPWQTQVTTALTAQAVPQDKITQVIELLSGMIKYENRTTASELLQSPLFEEDVHFHLHLPPDFPTHSQDKIAFYRASDVKSDEYTEQPAILIDRRERVARHCYHLPKDPADQYIVVVSRGTEKRFKSVKIEAGDHIHLDASGTDLSITTTKQTAVVQTVALAAVSQQPRKLEFGSDPIATTTTTTHSALPIAKRLHKETESPQASGYGEDASRTPPTEPDDLDQESSSPNSESAARVVKRSKHEPSSQLDNDDEDDEIVKTQVV